MKTLRLVISCLIVCFACPFAEATSHQLIGGHLLDIGNRWEYQIHITEDPDTGPVDWWGTVIREVVRNETIEGYDTVLYEDTGEIPGVVTWWQKSNYYLTSEYLVEVRSEDKDIIRLVRNNDPFEYAPVWVDELDNNRHFGHGEHYGTLKDPYYTWDGYRDNYITFLRTEPITVPAGSFDCVVVFVRSEFHELEGLWGYVEMTVWANLEVGIVKTDEYAWVWDPVEQRASTARGTTELTSFSLVNHNPQLSGGLVTPTSGDTKTDFYWYVDYYDEDGDPPSTNDVYIDGIAYEMSLDSGSASDGTYRCGPMKLDEGSHNYYFYFTDGHGGSDRLPSSGTSSGPSVTAASIVFSPDFDGDGCVDLADFAFLASNWMRNDCNISNQWCHETDLYFSGNVDELDLAVFCDSWLTDFSLVAYWPLDDNDSNAFVSDISGNGHNGTASANTSLLSAQGMVNTCFDFAGTDAVEINDDDALSFDDTSYESMSIAAWVYVTHTGNHQNIITKNDFANHQEWDLRLDTATKLRFRIFDESSGKYAEIITKWVLPVGWHFIVATYDSTGGATASSGMNLFVDGNLLTGVNRTTQSGYVAMENKDAKVAIGAAYLGGGRVGYFADKIDNVLLFSKCLTPAEITALYGEGL